MCGIVVTFLKQKVSGAFLHEANISNTYVKTERMLNAIRHRGQDEVVVHQHNTCVVGYRRLSITEKNIPQPQYTDDWVVYLNGEIYNYQELGFDGCESFVVAQGLQTYGVGFIKQLNGMFFIVAVNRDNVYVFRDRYGIKPAYYTETKEHIIVASEIKAIVNQNNFQTKINSSVVRQWLTFNNTFTDETMFSGIFKVEKGTIWHLNTGNKWKYWSWQFSPKPIDYTVAVTQLRLLFKRAIERQIPKETSFGSCLSGGLDSNIIVAHLPPTHTFTVGFSDTDDERDIAQLSAGKRHHEIVYNDVYHFDETIYHLEDLRVGASWSNYGLYQTASKHVKVLFDGAGGDELFAGYSWRYSNPNYYNVVNRTGRHFNENVRLFNSIFFQDTLENRFAFDAVHFLEGVLLVVDKLSMASIIEVRLPFLDNDLVDFATTLPNEYKQNKKILRDAFGHMLPKEVLNNPKRGFSSPDWFRGEGNQANKWATAAFEKWLEVYNNVLL
jgi:asparagine synthase (glutamine-hydrolysing)